MLELRVDNFGDTVGSLAFMRSEEFAGNPLGSDVDPEKLVAARAAGASREELHRRGYAGEYVPTVAQPALRPWASVRKSC